jgi:hypothetical protein
MAVRLRTTAALAWTTEKGARSAKVAITGHPVEDVVRSLSRVVCGRRSIISQVVRLGLHVHLKIKEKRANEPEWLGPSSMWACKCNLAWSITLVGRARLKASPRKLGPAFFQYFHMSLVA